MKNLQNIIGGEKNFLFSDKKIFCGEENFFGYKKIFLQVTEKYYDQDLEETEKAEEKSEFSKKDYEEVGEKIFGDSEKTKNILEKKFQKFSQRVFNFDQVDGRMGLYGTNFQEDGEYFDIVTNFNDKIGSLQNSIGAKIGILTDGNNEEYKRLVFQEKQIQLTLENLNKVKDQKIHSLEKSQNALKALNEMKGFFGKTGDFVKTVGTLGVNKVVENWDERNARKEIEKLNKVEQKLDEKLNKVVSQKEKIEGRFEKKMGKVDNIVENLDGVLDGFDLTKEEKEGFIQNLKEGKIFVGFNGRLTVQKGDKEIEDVIVKINSNEVSSDLSRKVLLKSIKEFNKKNIDQFKNFSKTKRKMEYFEENKDLFEEIKKNEKKFEELDKKENGEILKDLKFEVGGKKFEGNFEINKTKNGEIFFIETNKDGNLDSSCEWGKDSVVVFDKEKGFIEVNDEFLKQKENKEVSEKIFEKLEEIKNSFEKVIGENLKDKKKRGEFLEGYKKFASKYKEVFKEFKIFNGAFEKIEKVEDKKEIKNKKEELEKAQKDVLEKIGVSGEDLKESSNTDYKKRTGNESLI